MPRLRTYNMDRKTFFWYRILPGVISLILFTSPIWTSLLGIYDLLIIYLAFLAIYVFFKSIQACIGYIIGYRRMQNDTSRDWVKDLKALDFSKLPDPKILPRKLEDLHIILFIPIVKEPYDVLKKALDTYANQDYPHMEKVILVLAVEERAGPEQKKVIQKLKNYYKGKFGYIWDFYHPVIPGEIQGDACSNLRWAAIHTSRKLQKLGINSKHCIFNKCDSDTRFHPKYLSAYTHAYLTAEDRYKKFYGTAIIIYSNNFWRIPFLIRVFTYSLTLGIVSEWVMERGKKQSFSCYGANFHLLEKIDFWDAQTGAEDTYFYWNAYLHLNGDFIGQPFFIPVHMDAVEGPTTAKSYKALYKQQVRWGWGALIMPIALQGMAWNKRIPLQKKLSRFTLLARAYNYSLTISTLLALSMPVLTLINKELEYSAITYLLPRTISYLMTASIVFQIPTKYYLWKFYGSPPKEKSLLFKIWWWGFEHFTMIINIWTYYFLPRIQSQFELTIGKKRLIFAETEKMKTTGEKSPSK